VNRSTMTARARTRALALADRAQRVPGAHLVVRIVRDIAVNDLTDRSMTLAAQAFTSVLPIVILLTALPSHDFIDTALTNLGIDPSRVDIPSATSPGSITAYGVIGALMTIAGATSLSRALGRMYVSIWQVTKLPLSSWWRWVVVIFALPLGVVLQGLSSGLHSITITGLTIAGYGAAGVVLEVVATLVIWSGMWTLIPRLLVSSQVPVRLLALNGAVTGAFVTVLLVGSRIALPTILGETTRHFGTLGIVFVAISWLFFFCAIIVTCVIVVHSLTSDDGAVGQWLQRHLGTPRPFPVRRNETVDDLFGAVSARPAGR
jgi:membrane protein